jgi:hypothetical protein
VGFEDEDDGSFFMLWSDFVQVSPWSFLLSVSYICSRSVAPTIEFPLTLDFVRTHVCAYTRAIQWFEEVEVCDPTILSTFTEGPECR